MSFHVTAEFARRYQAASRPEKGRTLDELVARTGWSRDHARRVIRQALTRPQLVGLPIRRTRGRKYSRQAATALRDVWRATGRPCGKAMAPKMDELLARAERRRPFWRPKIDPAVADELRRMSPATIDRYLAPHKASHDLAQAA
ncbi:MAG: hypothetical protein LBR32_07020 [Propionibacteriaceae bacterium]|jgi:hypothetical protein|nr:hypothetical protein [Propionibacteriaceae bacterium]